MERNRSSYYFLSGRLVITLVLLVSMEILSFSQKSDTISSKQLSNITSELKFDSTRTIYVQRSFGESKNQNRTLQNAPDVKMPSGDTFSAFVSVIAYILAGALIIMFLYFFIKEYRNRKIEVEVTDYTIDQIDDIEKANLGSLLAKALQQNDYRLAIRIQFLMLLQRFQWQNLIQWRPNKTNRQYINELKDASFKNQFSHVSRIFERTWYGGNSVDEEQYQEFSKIIQQIIPSSHA